MGEQNNTISSARIIEATVSQVKTYDAPRLRWVVPDETSTDGPRLQEGIAWRSATAAGIEWSDVPTIVLPAPPHP